MEENKFWAFVWAVVCTTIVTLTAIGCSYCYSVNTKMALLGYEQVTIAGNTGTVWQKTD